VIIVYDRTDRTDEGFMVIEQDGVITIYGSEGKMSVDVNKMLAEVED